MVAATRPRPKKNPDKTKPKKPAAKPAGAKVKKVAKAKATAEEKEALDAQQLKNFRRMQKLAEQSDEWQRQCDDLKKQHKDLRGSISQNSVEIRRLLLANKEKMPLFDKPAAQTQGLIAGNTAQNGGGTKPLALAAPATNGQSAGTAKADPDAWKKYKLKDSLVKLGSATFTKGIDALVKHGIETIGQLEDRRAKAGAGKWFEGVPGLGREGADEIENAHCEFLSRTRDAKAFAEAKSATPAAK